MTSHPGLATFSSAGGSLGFENSEPSTGSKVQIHCQVAGCDNLLPAGKVYYAVSGSIEAARVRACCVHLTRWHLRLAVDVGQACTFSCVTPTSRLLLFVSHKAVQMALS